MSDYSWNVRVTIEGVTFEGPGMESRGTAEAILGLVEDRAEVQSAEVFRDE